MRTGRGTRRDPKNGGSARDFWPLHLPLHAPAPRTDPASSLSPSLSLLPRRGSDHAVALGAPSTAVNNTSPLLPSAKFPLMQSTTSRREIFLRGTSSVRRFLSPRMPWAASRRLRRISLASPADL